MADPFGKALRDYLNGNPSTTYTIRRDDGHVDHLAVEAYFREYPTWKETEKKVLRFAQGRVLDIGAGAGRHSLYLQSQGFDVVANDVSLLAFEVMLRRGIKNVCLMDVKRLNFPAKSFDSILMLGNNFGLAGTVEETKKLLRVLYRISTGRIITTITDPYKTEEAEHLSYHERNRKAGRPVGQVKIRIEYKGEIGSWSYLLMVSPEELKGLIKDTGWNILRLFEGSDQYYYGAVLGK